MLIAHFFLYNDGQTSILPGKNTFIPARRADRRLKIHTVIWIIVDLGFQKRKTASRLWLQVQPIAAADETVSVKKKDAIIFVADVVARNLRHFHST